MQNLVDVGRREGGLRREGIFCYFLCFILFYNNNNNLTCKAPVCAKKDFSGAGGQN